MAMERCPDENVLTAFSGGQLSGTALELLEAHLDGCAACRGVLALMSSGAPAAPVTRFPQRETIGRYRVERLLGAGGMGRVWAARDEGLQRSVALKLLHTDTSEARQRLLREAQTMARLSHPNLVPVFELGRDGDDDFIAMELIDGPALDHWLKASPRSDSQVLALFLDAGRGLEAAHRAGVVHRDFKPQNVLVGADGRARVTDFGLSRLQPGTGALSAALTVTRAGTLLGTPAYMAPEQLDGKPADARSDQFSFCVALAEALTGERPFSGRSPAELREAMNRPPRLSKVQPRALRLLLTRGLFADPAHRWPDLGALLAALEAAARPRKISRRAALLALPVAAITFVAAWQLTRPPGAGLERNVLLKVGARQKLEVPFTSRIERLALGDPEIADVALEENDIFVKGLSPGATTLLLWTGGGRHSFTLRVHE